jgi:deoxyadenosine kinase
MSVEPLHVGLSGLIGAGKSTLAEHLGKALELPVYYERVADNVYLADFYADMRKYAFSFQIYLLNNRLEQQQQIVWSSRGGVQDRTIYEDGIFARMLAARNLMEQRDLETYQRTFRNVSNNLRHPNLIVHLDVAPEVCLQRITQRNREFERGITLDYLHSLQVEYEKFLQEISTSVRVIRVNWNDNPPNDPRRLAELIKQKHTQMRSIETLL